MPIIGWSFNSSLKVLFMMTNIINNNPKEYFKIETVRNSNLLYKIWLQHLNDSRENRFAIFFFKPFALNNKDVFILKLETLSDCRKLCL